MPAIILLKFQCYFTNDFNPFGQHWQCLQLLLHLLLSFVTKEERSLAYNVNSSCDPRTNSELQFHDLKISIISSTYIIGILHESRNLFFGKVTLTRKMTLDPNKYLCLILIFEIRNVFRKLKIVLYA